MISVVVGDPRPWVGVTYVRIKYGPGGQAPSYLSASGDKVVRPGYEDWYNGGFATVEYEITTQTLL